MTGNEVAAGEAAVRQRDRRTLRRSLTYTLVTVALVSVLLLGALNYWQARTLINSTVEDVLVDQQITRSQAVRSGLDRLRNQVSLIAADSAVVAGVTDFSAAVGELGDAEALLTPQEEAAVAGFYAEVATLIADAGLDAPDLIPQSAVARYLQYHYLIENPNPAGARGQLTASTTDASTYADVHALRHGDMVRVAAAPAVADLLLVDTAGTVVYSVEKRIDLGTSLLTGPHRDSALARAVLEQVPAVPAGEAVYVDFERYLPAAAEPALFAAAAVRSGGTTIGAVVVQIPIEALDAITTSNGGWDETGLGDTGEAYVVGSDSLMRSNSRRWLEDSEAYLAEFDQGGGDPEVARLMNLFDSTVLLQPADTPAVEAALDGEMFVGRSPNYLGRKTLSVASPVGAEQLDWVLVTSVDADEATAPLDSYTRRILVVAAILVPLVGLVGAALSTRMTRPVEPIVAAAADVADGILDTELPDLGRNEFGDVARRLNVLTSDLRHREAELTAEEGAISTLLLSALPPRIVAGLRGQDRDLNDLLDTATIVAIGVEGLLDHAGLDQESALAISVRLARELEEVADDLSIERVRSSSAEHVFAAGLATPETAAPLGAEFAVRVARTIAGLSERVGVDLTYRIGLCGGEVVAVLLSGEQLTYGVIGDAMRTAQALQSIASPNQILVCDGTVGDLQLDWRLSAVPGLVDLRGEPVAAHVLDTEPGRSATAAARSESDSS